MAHPFRFLVSRGAASDCSTLATTAQNAACQAE